MVGSDLIVIATPLSSNEDVILKIRLNILYDVVDKFIISEGAFNHRGIKRELNFNIENYKEFSKTSSGNLTESRPRMTSKMAKRC